MSVEEILIAEYGKGKVSIEKAKKGKDGTMDVRTISRDGRKEFKAQAIISVKTKDKTDNERELVLVQKCFLCNLRLD